MSIQLMNFAAFIKSISANPVTSIINFNKHWQTLLRIYYKHWPWSLFRCEVSYHATLFSTMRLLLLSKKS